MSDKKDNDKGWLAFIKEIFVFELIMALIDWVFGILESVTTILRIIFLILLIIGAAAVFLQT